MGLRAWVGRGVPPLSFLPSHPGAPRCPLVYPTASCSSGPFARGPSSLAFWPDLWDPWPVLYVAPRPLSVPSCRHPLSAGLPSTWLPGTRWARGGTPMSHDLRDLGQQETVPQQPVSHFPCGRPAPGARERRAHTETCAERAVLWAQGRRHVGRPLPSRRLRHAGRDECSQA